MDVRRLTPDDWRIWRDVRLAALRDAPAAFYSTLEREADYDDAEWAGLLLPEQGIKVVAFAEGRTVGAVGGFPSEDVAGAVDLFGMWVAPEARGSGLADRLVAEVVAWAGERGCHEVRLWVTEGNQRALRMYQRAGFVATEEYWPHPTDRDVRYQLMTRQLGGQKESATSPPDPQRGELGRAR